MVGGDPRSTAPSPMRIDFEVRLTLGIIGGAYFEWSKWTTLMRYTDFDLQLNGSEAPI